MQPVKVAVVAFDQIRPFHLSVPCAVFGETESQSLFQLRVCAAEQGDLHTTAGFGIAARHGLRELSQADVIVVPSWRNPHESAPEPLLANRPPAPVQSSTAVPGDPGRRKTGLDPNPIR